MIGLIIYLVGFIMAYRKMKIAWVNEFGDFNPWSRVSMSFLVALMSWFGFLIGVMLDPESPSINPPKWL